MLNLPLDIVISICYNINKIREAENPRPQKGIKNMTQAEFEKYMNETVKPFCETISESFKLEFYTASEYRWSCLNHAILYVGIDRSLTVSQLRQISEYIREQCKIYCKKYNKIY